MKHEHSGWDARFIAAVAGLAILALYFALKVHGLAADTLPEYTVDEIEESIILAGDGGDMPQISLKMLEQELARLPKPSRIVFLGDNIYPDGLPAVGTPDYEGARERLFRQITPVQKANVQPLFIPGNHDWNFSRKGGWAAVIRQQNLLVSLFGNEGFSPKNGCPGPDVAYQSRRFRVISLDTEWWGHPGEKPNAPESGCPAFTRDGLAALLDKTLKSKPPGVEDIVVSHHPFESVGTHAEKEGCPNDFGCPSYEKMRSMILPVFAANSPMLCIAGHDHSLQLLHRKEGCRTFAVSGSLSHSDDVFPDEETLFAENARGIMRLDALKDGRKAITVIYLKDGSDEPERFATWLK